MNNGKFNKMQIIVVPNSEDLIPGYARVSSREQAENTHALEQQIERLKAAGATVIYVDIESRSKDDREELAEVLHLIETRRCKEAIFVRIDRMTDSSVLLEKAITICLESNVRVRGLDDAIDFHTVGGRLHARLLVNIARAEVERLAERVRHGWAHLRNRKVAMNPPFGYCKIDDAHKLDHTPFLCLLTDQPSDPALRGTTEMWLNGTAPAIVVQGLSKAMIAREIVETFLEKRTLRLTMRDINEHYGIQTFAHNNQPGKSKGGRVAQGMFRFSPGGLRNWLTNPVLQGHLCYLRGGEYKGRKEIHYNTHADERLISDEEAREIEAVLKHNHQVRGYGSTALKYPLSGLVFCGECRSSCYSVKGGRGKNQPGYNYYFQCKNWRVRGCTQKSLVRMEKAEDAVIDALLRQVNAITTTAEQITEKVEPLELQELRAELAFYQNAPGNRAEAIVSDLRRQIESFQHRTQREDSAQAGNRELLLQVFGNPVYWKTLGDEEKREIYRSLVDRVIVRNGQVEQVILKV